MDVEKSAAHGLRSDRRRGKRQAETAGKNVVRVSVNDGKVV